MSAKGVWIVGLVLGIIITGLVVANTGELENVSRNFSEKLLKVPTERAPIYIDGNENFNAANGVTSGNGTADNPFVIENWDINASSANGIEIRNTNAHFIIKNCRIHDGKSSYKYGVYFYNVSNGKIDFVISYNNYCGIYLGSSSNNQITNCNVYNNSYCIYLGSSSSNIITNCVVYNNSEDGIYLYSSSNNNITDCTFYNNSYSIMLSSSSNNNITDCTFYNNSNGTYLYSSSNNNQITNCNVYNNSDYGVYLGDSSNNNEITTCSVYNNSYGIRLASSSNNNITSCTVYNNSYGISVYSSLNNQIINCAIYKNSYGIRTYSANNTYIENCEILNSTNVGVDISYLTTYIINSTISNSMNYDIYLNSSTLYLFNTTFTNVSFADISSTLVRSWYLDVNVTDIYNNTIPYASVCVKDALGNYIGDFSSGMSGVAQNIPCIAYIQNNTGKNYSMNNHTASVGNSTVSVNMSENKKEDKRITVRAWRFSILGIIEEEITYENYTIIQENNLTIAENGALTLKNVILKMNCTDNGSHYIEVLSGAEMYILNNSNITSTNPNNHYLFWVRNESKFEMMDSELSECGWDSVEAGLTIETNATFIDNCTFLRNYCGLYFNYSSSNIITNCTVYNNSWVGIILDSSLNNAITNCAVYNNSGDGVWLCYSSNNTITNCAVYDNSYYGIYLHSSSNNAITNCAVYNNLDGIYLYYYSSNNQIINCAVYDNSDYGILLGYSSNDSQITNCTIYNNSYVGIYLSSSSNNTLIANCSILKNRLGGVESSDSSTIITNTTISENGCGSYSDKGGIYCDKSMLTIENCQILSNTFFGITLTDSSGSLTNSNISDHTDADIGLYYASVGTCLNTFFNKTKVYVGVNSTLNISWYLHINVLWNNSVPAEGANTRIQDNINGTFDENYITDENGWVRNVAAQEYTQNQTNTTYFTPYTINASQGAFWNLTSVPITNTVGCTLYLNLPYIHNAPVITDTSPDLEYALNENITREFKFNISHPNNLTLTYHWYLDDVEVENGTLENTSTVQLLDFTYYFNYTSSGAHKIRIMISDSNATVSRTWTLTVININAPPMIIEVSPTWSCMSITEEQNVNFGVIAVDVDGDKLSYWWYIYYENMSVPVEEYGGVNGNNTIIFGRFDTIGNYTVEIKVYETGDETSIATHTWLLKVWNITELNLQIAELQQLIYTMGNTIANLTSNITELNASISALQAQLDNLTTLYNNLSAQISSLTSERDNAERDKLDADNRTAQAEKEKEEAIDAMHTAQYKLAASVVGAAIAGVFAGAFVFSLLLKKRKGSK